MQFHIFKFLETYTLKHRALHSLSGKCVWLILSEKKFIQVAFIQFTCTNIRNHRILSSEKISEVISLNLRFVRWTEAWKIIKGKIWFCNLCDVLAISARFIAVRFIISFYLFGTICYDLFSTSVSIKKIPNMCNYVCLMIITVSFVFQRIYDKSLENRFTICPPIDQTSILNISWRQLTEYLKPCPT